MNKVLATVILYNPDETVIDNIYTYLNYVEEVVIVDNSDHLNHLLVEKLKGIPKAIYIGDGVNKGIAKALNIAAEFGVVNGYNWLLTMDQDSMFEDGEMAHLINDLNIYDKQLPNMGILTPQHQTQTKQLLDPSVSANGVFEIKTCMTSGNLVNLNIWKQVGGFVEKLFIDYVDHEYCLRIRKYGSVIYQTNNAVLKHFLGDEKQFKLAGLNNTTSHHNYIRRYYITRNRLYTVSRYIQFDPAYCCSEIYNFFAEGFKLLIQEDNKVRKIQSILRAGKDFVIGKYGKYDQG
jgi:rhamnosyltransferase